MTNAHNNMIKDESLHLIPESDCELQDILGPLGNHHGPGAKPVRQRTRSRLFRMPSEMLKSTLDTDDDDDIFGDSSKHDAAAAKQQQQRQRGAVMVPTEYRELVERQARSKQRPQHQQHLACLRKAASLRHITRSNSFDGFKRVRFATNKTTKRPWCFVQEYEKEPASQKSVLWWSETEMHAKSEDDEDILDRLERRYGTALETAYESAKSIGVAASQDPASTSRVELSFLLLASCADARGLETDVTPKISDLVDRHRRAVLKTQQLILSNNHHHQEDEDSPDNDKDGGGSQSQLSDEEHKLIRLQSIKHSNACVLVARRLAAFDQQFLEQMNALENSLYDDSEFLSEGDVSGIFDSQGDF
eukprot:CAMPEP_0168754336 /NCGR_PEP_ID=MMETSP0724-20121128/19446_1 /TAXON_ID=265536 /ORGANISM="Amphiprora sp., Strain CCMP467" /LENGTH=360 /DNA_ID=CAMNT_0008802807 /DNA_START=375 /DNA_END=1457 /DNA_ORIENTATION=-